MTRRLSLAWAVIIAATLSAPAYAQTARATGTVRDLAGKALKGATIRALNPDAVPSEITAVADDKGRWAMIGMRVGTWTFVAEAPGYHSAQTQSVARTANNQPLVFTLARDPGPVPNALAANIQQQLAAANALRDEGRLEQAITAYEEIRAKNPTLTHVTLVIADTYRTRAAAATEPAARRTLLDQAIASYGEVLKADGNNAHAKTALATTRAEAAAVR